MFRRSSAFFKNKAREIGVGAVREEISRLPQKTVEFRKMDLGISYEIARESKKPEPKFKKFDWSGYTFDPAFGWSKTVVRQVKSAQLDDGKCKRGKALRDDAPAGSTHKSR